MSAWIRSTAPFALLGLALLAWFERCIPGAPEVAQRFGDAAVLRFVTGCLCVYVALLMLEAQHKAALLKQVLGEFKRFHTARSASGGEARGEAIRILTAALESSDPAVRESARSHLTRLVGRDLGPDPDPWRRHVAEESDAP